MSDNFRLYSAAAIFVVLDCCYSIKRRQYDGAEQVMKALNELYKFGLFWRTFENFKVMPQGNYSFEASIKYESDVRGSEQQDCAVMISRTGINDGQIDILDRGILEAKTHHLQFSPNFQSYELNDEDKSLEIQGRSPKMGAYKIKIRPNNHEVSFH